jgi:receptor-type tyrosine-protein phosphatase Q/CUB/sushi domain-containing protein
VSSSKGVTYDDLFKYGSSSSGDSEFPSNDDEYTSINLNLPFVFYGTPYNKTFINNNGVISFLAPVSNYTPESFPLNIPIIAPFWADVDTRGVGTVWYRLTSDASTVMNVREKVSSYFSDDPNFLPNEVLIVSWAAVGYYNYSNIHKNNTFQCILASDGDTSYVLFLFPENGINWYSGDATCNGIDGVGGVPAIVGINKGDGVIFHITNLSSTENVIYVEDYTNVNKPGLYMWRVTDSKEDGAGNCTTEGR